MAGKKKHLDREICEKLTEPVELSPSMSQTYHAVKDGEPARSKKANHADLSDDLCRRAKELARHKSLSMKDIEALSSEEIRLAIHELLVHQIGLELQNEELCRIQVELDEARARYLQLYDLAPVGYLTVSKKGIFLEANLTAASLLDMKREELVGQPIVRVIFDEDHDIYYLLRKQLFETGQPQTCELRMIKNDGTLFWARLATTAMECTGEAVFRVVISDISERIFRANELELTDRLILLVNAPGNFRELMSGLTAALQKWSGCEAVGIRLREGDDFPYYETRGFSSEFVEAERYLCAYGPDNKILRDDKGNPLLECMCGNVLSGRFDPSKPFFTKNGSFWSNNTTALLASTTEADRQSRTRNRCNGEGYESVALIPLRVGGQVFGLLQFNDRQTDRFTTSLIDHFERIADSLSIALSRHQVEEVLREKEKNYGTLMNSGRALVWTAGEDKLCNYFNSIWLEFTGRTLQQEMGNGWTDGVHPEDLQQCLDTYVNAFDRREKFSIEYRLRRHDGEYRWILDDGCPRYNTKGEFIGYIGHCLDITDRKQLETQYLHAQKMEAIGQLAGGVAHDFRNQLTVIQGFASMLLHRSRVTEEGQKDVEEILKAVRRSATITNQLLIFSRKESIHLETVNLNESIRAMARLLPQMIGEDIRLLIISSPKACWANVDPGLFQQAIMNMVVNARHAMPHGGKLTVETGRAELTIQALRGIPNASPGDYVVVTISDTGAGMDAKTQQHIFDPFFTTKEVGAGTGMGLAMVYGFVAQSKGFIQVDSKPGKGSTFRLYFPMVQPVEASTEREGEVAPELDAMPEGSETILLVEDEESLRQLAVSMLRECGYTVLEAANAAEALPLGEHYEGQIDLLATDVVMPNMMGTELAERLRIARPNMPVLFMSGYSKRLTDDTILQKPGTAMLVKPFDFTALAQAVRRLLDPKKQSQ